jgi:hypothetical protein
MSDPTALVLAVDGDALLAELDALHDDDPRRALELLRALDPATVSTARLARLSFLLDHVVGEKFDLWPEALDAQRRVVQQAGQHASPLLYRHAAIAAQMAGDTDTARAWTLSLAASADAPLAKARALVSLGAVAFSVDRAGAETAASRCRRCSRWPRCTRCPAAASTPRSARWRPTSPRPCWNARWTTSPSPTCAWRCN